MESTFDGIDIPTTWSVQCSLLCGVGVLAGADTFVSVVVDDVILTACLCFLIAPYRLVLVPIVKYG